MKIAITGANGRVGTAVVARALVDGHEVLRIDRVPDASPDSRFVHLDLHDFDGLVEALRGSEALIHLAAISGPGRHPDHLVHGNNVVLSYNALRAAREVGIERVCQASSINAIGGRFSQWPRYDYFPLDEDHPTYAEDPYSISKWVCEQQADGVARRYPGMSIASLRLHGVVPGRADTAGWVDAPGNIAAKQLWGYTTRDAAARACILGVTTALSGHEVFYIVAPETMVDTPSAELRDRHYPEVPFREEMPGIRGFFDCSKAELLMGWQHDET